jgi:sugar transferase (PEP-CTERM/EpsH1 system associated)
MKILVLTPMLPYPPSDGARIRNLNLIKQLVKVHEVSLLSFVSVDDDVSAQVSELRKFIGEVRTVQRDTRYSPQDLLKGVCGSEPFSILNFKSPEMEELVSEFLGRGFDAIHCSHLHMAQYAPTDDSILKVVDMHNVESEILERYAEKVWDPLRKHYAKLTASKLSKYEKEHLQGFDLCTAVSARDAESFARTGVSTEVIENGVDTGYFPFKPNTETDESLTFTGWMKYHANDEAARFFCSEVLPLIRKKNSKVHMTIVGKSPSKEVQALGEGQGIKVTGFVPDVRPYLYAASVFVVPLLVGGGTRLKILEAMSAGIPVVSTSVGCEGLQVQPGRHLLVADTPEDFAYG